MSLTAFTLGIITTFGFAINRSNKYYMDDNHGAECIGSRDRAYTL